MRRLIAIGVLCPAAGLTLAAGWSAYLGMSVRDHLQATQDALVRLGASDPAGAAGSLADAQRHAEEARRLTSGQSWSLIGRISPIGDGATTVRGLAEAAAGLTGVLRDVHRVVAGLISVKGLSLDNVETLPASLESATPVLRDAARRIDLIRSGLASTPAETGVDALDQARATALREIDKLRGWLAIANDAAVKDTAALLPEMLGYHGQRRYFLAFQTNAEARGTGGLVGAFGILKANDGHLSIERLSSNNHLVGGTVPVVDHGPAFLKRYGPSAVSLMANSNLSPHFPYAAKTWLGLWERQTGEQLDGAIATDPVALSYLLKVIGPVTLPSGERVTADNVVDLTEREAYARYPDPLKRKEFLIAIASTVSKAITQSRPDPLALLSALSQMVDERRIQIWSRRDSEQRRLAATPISGVLPRKPGPFAGLVVINSAGTKLDYYLERSLHYELGPCRSDGTRVSKVWIQLNNNVPQGKLPKYVIDRLDLPPDRRAAKSNGSNRLWLSFYAGAGAKANALRIDGKPARIIRHTERSHPVYDALLEFAPKQSRTLEFDLLEPYSTNPPVVPVQPLVRPQYTRITQDNKGCPTGASTTQNAGHRG
ncbi:DUF4012 domain-containing protein [Nonomuraea sp. SYSU D8015]|uniref:DUF4012 domain-containing protein n=1 Tax=Nonomuraea sp. SYSU D8015 TaxID=2593644 RepID=UPI001660F5FA|nr:DUF4012 domain-containing protein [Nonomuraea sp. SYSU D8015]